MSSKKWFGFTLLGVGALLCAFSFFIVIIDPFLHFHKPIEKFVYPLEDSRYINDGIFRNYDFDMLIIGTSMTSNFKTTECDEIFHCTSVKAPYHGASFREVGDNLKNAISVNPNLKSVIRCLDEGNFTQDKDYINYEGIPYYMYDKNPFNDVSYIFNKTIFIGAGTILAGETNLDHTPTMDEYMSWDGDYEYGKEAVLAHYVRPGKEEHDAKLSDMERKRTIDNMRQNVVDIAKENPDITFYCYFSPYSICYWDVEVMQPGKLDWYMDLQKTVIEELLACDNIKLYSFDDNTELTCNLDNYQDVMHYSGEINTCILRWIKDGQGRLTKENYQDYLERIRDFYGAYDYDSIYEANN